LRLRQSGILYRPVSLIAVCYTLIRSIIRGWMMYHLRTNRLLNRSQHKFMQVKSCCSDLSSLKIWPVWWKEANHLTSFWTSIKSQGNAFWKSFVYAESKVHYVVVDRKKAASGPKHKKPQVGQKSCQVFHKRVS
jgi:hypothetical protein